MNKRKVHFTKIGSDEVKSKLNQIKSKGDTVTVWIKGRAVRETYTVIEIINAKKLKVYPTKTTHLMDNDVLFKFEAGGLNYFSTAKLYKDSNENAYFIDIGKEVFKSERRSSYRLLTYPAYDVKISFYVQDNYKGSNVVDIKTGTSQTGIFKSFLKIMGQKDANSSITEIIFRVQDISVSGVSFVIGKLDNKYFKKDETIENFKIYFDGEEFIVENARIVYVIDYIQADKKGLKQHKVGLEFSDVSTTMDSMIGKKINEILRSNESNDEFEDFIE